MINSVVCIRLLTASLCLIGLSAPGQASTEPGPFSRLYFDALLADSVQAQEALPEITRAGEGAAARLAAGGRLYVACARHDFVSEARVRAGGLMCINEYRRGQRLSPEDAVVVGWSNITPEQDLALVRELSASGAFVIGIGPKSGRSATAAFLSEVDVHLDSSTSADDDARRPFGGEAYPFISLKNLALLWAFTGEMTAALTRQGIMPAFYQSVLVPGARERNRRHEGKQLVHSPTIPPVPPGQLGRNYLVGLGRSFRSLRDEEAGTIDRVARTCLEVKTSGNRIHAWLISHFPYHQPGMPGDPGFFEQLEKISGEVPTTTKLEKTLQSGDLFFFLGYYRRPAEAYQVARRAGASIVEVVVGLDDAPLKEPTPDHIIRPWWPYGDALVSVPNYDIRILPSSGIVQASIYWAVVGSMVAER
jgi:uncharacterized phosphosugar-binding protein